MRTSTVSFFATRPSPWQFGQRLRSRPVPSQRGHVRLKRIAPAICSTCPVPLHSGHVALLPLRAPVPWVVCSSLICPTNLEGYDDVEELGSGYLAG